MTSLWVYFRCFLSAIRRRQWINMNWELTGACAVWSRLRSALMWGWTRGDAALETFTAVTPDSARSLDLHLKPPEPNERTCSLIAIRYSSTSRAAGNLQCRRPECTNCDVIIDLWHRYISVYCKTETKLWLVPYSEVRSKNEPCAYYAVIYGYQRKNIFKPHQSGRPAGGIRPRFFKEHHCFEKLKMLRYLASYSLSFSFYVNMSKKTLNFVLLPLYYSLSH